MFSEEETRRGRGGGGSVRGVWMSVTGRFVGEVEARDGTGDWGAGGGRIVGATRGTGPRRGGMVGTRGCWERSGALRRGVQWVAKRTRVGLGVDRIAPGRGGGVRKRFNQTWMAGRGERSISHSFRAILALCGIAPRSRRTSVRITFACGGQARAGRVRRWASGLIRGGEMALDTTARSTCEGGGRLPATARKLTGAEDRARASCPVPPPTSGGMCGLTRASQEEEGAEEEEGEWRRSAGEGGGAKGVPRVVFSAGLTSAPASSRA